MTAENPPMRKKWSRRRVWLYRVGYQTSGGVELMIQYCRTLEEAKAIAQRCSDRDPAVTYRVRDVRGGYVVPHSAFRAGIPFSRWYMDRHRSRVTGAARASSLYDDVSRVRADYSGPGAARALAGLLAQVGRVVRVIAAGAPPCR